MRSENLRNHGPTDPWTSRRANVLPANCNEKVAGFGSMFLGEGFPDTKVEFFSLRCVVMQCFFSDKGLICHLRPLTYPPDRSTSFPFLGDRQHHVVNCMSPRVFRVFHYCMRNSNLILSVSLKKAS